MVLYTLHTFFLLFQKVVAVVEICLIGEDSIRSLGGFVQLCADSRLHLFAALCFSFALNAFACRLFACSEDVIFSS